MNGVQLYLRTNKKDQQDDAHIILGIIMIHTHHTQCPLDIITTKTFPIPCNSYYDTSFITSFHLFIVTSPSLHKRIHKNRIHFCN